MLNQQIRIPSFPSFTPLTLTHYESYTALSKAMNLSNADLSFPELLVWDHWYQAFIAQIEHSFCVQLAYQGKTMLFPPVGQLPFLSVKDTYISYLKKKSPDGYIGGLSLKEAEQTGLPYTFDRDNSDYIYARTDLADLPGKKYHAKRNLIRQFQKQYAYEFKPLDCSAVHGCLELSEQWCDIRKCGDDPAVHIEEQAVRNMLLHCRDLKLCGGVLVVKNKIAAFTVASALNPEMAVIHIEKADTRYKGVYQAINYLFARTLKDSYQWINRESDIGEEGLRKAKLSYYPHHLNEKYYVRV